MTIVVSKKLYRDLRTAMLLQRFDMDYRRTRRAMIGTACLKCRKARLRAKVKTMWYRRYERRNNAS